MPISLPPRICLSTLGTCPTMRFKICFEKTSKKMRKYRILTSQNLPQTPSKSSQNRHPKKHRNFHRFSIDFAACCKSQTFIFVRMAIVLLGFYTIHAFAFRMRFRSQNPSKNLAKTRPEPFKNQCRKRVDFLRFRPRFGRVLSLQDGTKLAILAPQNFWTGPLEPSQVIGLLKIVS